MLTRLERVIKDNSVILEIDMNMISFMKMVLSQRTKDYIEKSKIDSWVMAVLIKEANEEAHSKDEIDQLLWNKMHDSNLVAELSLQSQNAPKPIFRRQ